VIPEGFRGAWQRISLSVDGGAWHEPARAVWVQASTAFADLRIPVRVRSAAAERDFAEDDCPAQPSRSFAGTTGWNEPYLRWNHRLDLHHEAGTGTTDVAATGWEDGCLVVAGTFDRLGERVPYVEMWERLPGSDGALTALVRSDGLGMLVQCGDHAVTVIDDRPHGGWYRACYRSSGAGLGWPVALALGAGSNALPAPPGGDLTGHTLPLDGGRWHVVERRTSSSAGSAGSAGHPHRLAG
jgi:hypothetical protein